MALWFFMSILVISHPTPSYGLEQLFYQKRPGLVWDNCNDHSNLSLLQCGIHCLVTDSCLGLNFQTDNLNMLSSCQLCVQITTLTVSSVPAGLNKALFFSYNRVIRAPTSGASYNVDFPQGLYQGQVIIFQVTPIDHRTMNMFFIDSKPFRGSNAPNVPEVDLMIDVQWNVGVIKLDNFNKELQAWRVHVTAFPISNFMSIGVEAEIIVFVTVSHYIIYVGGKHFDDYQRPQGIRLEDVKNIDISSTFSSVLVRDENAL